jgi:membrane protease YdiL (CAAX protease family)
MLATTLVLAVVQSSMPGLDLDQKQDVGFNNITDLIGLLAAFVALVVMAPVAEELIFRGYLFGNIRPLIGVTASVIVTSALFGLVHGQWNVGIDVAILSVFLCMLRVKTGSVWAGIFLHMAKNGLAYSFLFLAPFFREYVVPILYTLLSPFISN